MINVKRGLTSEEIYRLVKTFSVHNYYMRVSKVITDRTSLIPRINAVLILCEMANTHQEDALSDMILSGFDWYLIGFDQKKYSLD